jgi:hypothetical protein
MYPSSEHDPDTIDHEYAFSARTCFEANAARSRAVRSHSDDVKCSEFLDLPSDEENY